MKKTVPGIGYERKEMMKEVKKVRAWYAGVWIACLLLGSVFSPVRAAQSAEEIYKRAQGFFARKQWADARKLFKTLLEKYGDTQVVNVNRVGIKDKIMRCDFYKDEYRFDKVFKETFGLKQFRIQEGNRPYMELVFHFDDKKEARLFAGAAVSGGSLVQKSAWFAPRIKFTDPFMMTMQTDALPRGGMYIVLCADENFKGETKYYSVVLVRGRMSGFVIRKGRKKLGQKMSYSIKIPDRTRLMISKVGGKIVLQAGRITVSAFDTTYTGGYVYFGGMRGGGLRIDELVIKSYVDYNWFQSFKGDLENSRWIKFKREYEKKYGVIDPNEKAEEEGETAEGRDGGKTGKMRSSLNPLALLVDALRKEIQAMPAEDRNAYDACLKLVLQRKFNEAEKRLSALIKKHPSSFAGYHFRAMVKMWNTDFAGALEDIKKAEEKGGKKACISFARGMIYFRKGEFSPAAEAFKESFAADEEYIPAYIYHCLALYRGDDISRAERLMRAYAAKFPDDPLMKAGGKMFYLLKNGPAWSTKYTAEGPHYIVYSEISQANADLIRNHAEAVYNEYTKFFPYVKKKKHKYTIFVFGSFGSFADYAIDSGEMPPHPAIGGLFNPNLDHLLLRGDRSLPKVCGTLYHEGFHQYLDYYVKNAPTWFNEGFATFFEVSYFDQNGLFRSGVLNKQRLGVLLAALKGRVRGGRVKPLEEIMCADHAAFMQGLGNQVLVNYAQSWSLVYFMAMNRNLMDQFLRPYFNLLCKGASKEEAYEKVFKPRIRTIEKVWKDYYLTGKYNQKRRR